MILEGHVHRFGRDVDTDVIIPARYLNTDDSRELARHCMDDLDPGFAARVEPGDILVAGANFGCGSSREHAPVSIMATGVAAVVAVSFARIFYRNAINIGLPIVICPQAFDEVSSGDRMRLDLGAVTVENLTRGRAYVASPFPAFMQQIIDRGGLLSYVRAQLPWREAAIEAGSRDMRSCEEPLTSTE